MKQKHENFNKISKQKMTQKCSQKSVAKTKRVEKKVKKGKKIEKSLKSRYETKRKKNH